MEETDIGGVQRSFRSTLWTQVLTAKNPTHPDRRQALERLILAYWKPVYFFLRRRGYTVDRSKDITQGFFAAFLERDFLQYVERDRGKFRTFLLTAMEHFVADEYDRAKAQKRGGNTPLLSLNFVQAETEMTLEPASTETPDRVFRRRWALQVLERALQALRREFEADGRSQEFETLRLHFTVHSEKAPSYADVARVLGISETDVKSRLHRTRRRYQEAILEEIRSYTANEEEAQEELRDLFAALS